MNGEITLIALGIAAIVAEIALVALLIRYYGIPRGRR
jgi:hypothetical protein